MSKTSWVWWYTPLIPAPGRLRWENQEWKPAWARNRKKKSKRRLTSNCKKMYTRKKWLLHTYMTRISFLEGKSNSLSGRSRQARESGKGARGLFARSVACPCRDTLGKEARKWGCQIYREPCSYYARECLAYKWKGRHLTGKSLKVFHCSQ